MFQIFKEKLRPYAIFSRNDIAKYFPGFDTRRLVEWQQKGYVTKIRNRYYSFTDVEPGEGFSFLASNKIYSPSYVSLESALSYHSLIPEAVYSITAVTTTKTNRFSTSLGEFHYYRIHPRLFFGYQLVTFNNLNFRMAEPEKAILDLLYLRPEIREIADVEALRLNPSLLVETFDRSKFNDYLTLFRSRALRQRITPFLAYVDA